LLLTLSRNDRRSGRSGSRWSTARYCSSFSSSRQLGLQVFGSRGVEVGPVGRAPRSLTCSGQGGQLGGEAGVLSLPSGRAQRSPAQHMHRQGRPLGSASGPDAAVGLEHRPCPAVTEAGATGSDAFALHLTLWAGRKWGPESGRGASVEAWIVGARRGSWCHR